MIDGDSESIGDDEKFNETLKRMLETPPKPHLGDGVKKKPILASPAVDQSARKKNNPNAQS